MRKERTIIINYFKEVFDKNEIEIHTKYEFSIYGLS